MFNYSAAFDDSYTIYSCTMDLCHHTVACNKISAVMEPSLLRIFTTVREHLIVCYIHLYIRSVPKKVYT
jgi:hypothetical protein